MGGASFIVVVSDKKLKSGTTQEISNNIGGFGTTTQETTQEIEETTQEITDKIIQLMKSFCWGVQGGRFFQKESPLAAGGKKNYSFID
jgi:hypothetical protein